MAPCERYTTDKCMAEVGLQNADVLCPPEIHNTWISFISWARVAIIIYLISKSFTLSRVNVHTNTT